VLCAAFSTNFNYSHKNKAMYYKIENKESEVYRLLYQMRIEEKQMDKDNYKEIKKQTGLDFDLFLGHSGQQNFRRTRLYQGFQFNEPEKVDLKVWKESNDHPGIFIPNKRTKAGRQMSEFLANGLKGGRYDKPFEILGLPHISKFSFPFVEISGDLILVWLGDNQEPKEPNLIEITKTEFDRLLAAS